MTQTSDDIRILGPGSDIADLAAAAYYITDHKIRIAVVRVGEALYAFDDLCTYEACPLSAGQLDALTVMCQCHGCRFDVRTGKVLAGPAARSLGVYDVYEADGQIHLRLAGLPAN
ncbi:Rieske (2Fe-2S) protein [Nocardia sp. NPDC059177]|uniref:Rieske (2Fe-2S) protein n=1 Tax=Nocardia sp. NPDC059177 TaxID=3346759 RepID=UPI0036830D99